MDMTAIIIFGVGYAVSFLIGLGVFMNKIKTFENEIREIQERAEFLDKENVLEHKEFRERIHESELIHQAIQTSLMYINKKLDSIDAKLDSRN